jgi:hypothetical protein
MWTAPWSTRTTCTRDRDTGDDADIRAAHSALYATYRSRLRPLPGAADLLRACKRQGLAVVLASSADEPEFNMLVSADRGGNLADRRGDPRAYGTPGDQRSNGHPADRADGEENS